MTTDAHEIAQAAAELVYRVTRGDPDQAKILAMQAANLMLELIERDLHPEAEADGPAELAETALVAQAE